MIAITTLRFVIHKEEIMTVTRKTTAAPLKAPFPYPGGKSRIADLVWSRFGNVDNYIEPFMGTLAVLLRRPSDHFEIGSRVETANDMNHYVVNFWRAVRSAPDEVARWADSPVLEADMHARHKWLVQSAEAAEWRERMRTDPEAFDAKVAGWWVWGQCCWIAGGWCAHKVDHDRMPLLDPSQSDVHGVGRGATADYRCRPQLTNTFGIGRGVNGGVFDQIPGLIEHKGVHAAKYIGICDARLAWITDWMRRLSDRLRLVRTCYGHWSRICDSESTMTRLGFTGVFLDPPYPVRRGDTGAKSRGANLYATDKGADLDSLRDEVLAWCRKWGSNPRVCVAVCGYEGDGYESLVTEGWAEESWEANGGYANQRRGGKGKAENAKRERIWFSPHCSKPATKASLFDILPGAE